MTDINAIKSLELINVKRKISPFEYYKEQNLDNFITYRHLKQNRTIFIIAIYEFTVPIVGVDSEAAEAVQGANNEAVS
jgi:hypothetical protein